MVRVLFFGRLRDVAGAPAIDVNAEFSDLSQLRAHLSESNPVLGEALSAPSIRTAVDKVLTTSDALPRGAKEIAFMPPLSGG